MQAHRLAQQEPKGAESSAAPKWTVPEQTGGPKGRRGRPAQSRASRDPRKQGERPKAPEAVQPVTTVPLAELSAEVRGHRS